MKNLRTLSYPGRVMVKNTGSGSSDPGLKGASGAPRPAAFGRSLALGFSFVPCRAGNGSAQLNGSSQGWKERGVLHWNGAPSRVWVPGPPSDPAVVLTRTSLHSVNISSDKRIHRLTVSSVFLLSLEILHQLCWRWQRSDALPSSPGAGCPSSTPPFPFIHRPQSECVAFLHCSWSSRKTKRPNDLESAED